MDIERLNRKLGALGVLPGQICFPWGRTDGSQIEFPWGSHIGGEDMAKVIQTRSGVRYLDRTEQWLRLSERFRQPVTELNRKEAALAREAQHFNGMTRAMRAAAWWAVGVLCGLVWAAVQHGKFGF